MGKGDLGMEDIYHWDPVTGPRIAFKGPTGTTGESYSHRLIAVAHWHISSLQHTYSIL